MSFRFFAIAGVAFLSVSAMAGEFIKYSDVAKNLIAENRKKGLYATTLEVKHAIKSDKWAVVDVRTDTEWAGAYIPGSSRVGRQTPENALSNIVLDLDDNFVKKNIIVICNSAKRASIEAEIFRKMGFETVKIYDIYSWIDECNPVRTKYTVKKDKPGTGLKFGAYYAEHCYKQTKGK